MKRLLLVLAMAGCVSGSPAAPEDIPPQNTEWGVRRDTASITITIPNPFYEPSDSTDG